MSELTAAKSWSLSAIVSPGEQLRFLAADGDELDLNSLSPVEQLIGAICSCFAQSCAALMKYHGMPASSLQVSTWGHKPSGSLMGKGLDQLKLTVAFVDTVEPSRRRKLIDDTKKICTVTNSLSSSISIDIAVAETILAA